MKLTTTHLTLDVWVVKKFCVRANQGEVNSRFLEITLTDNSALIDLTGKTVIFYATKPDGNVIYNLCTIEDAMHGIISVCLNSQMSAVAGKLPCEIHILDTSASTLKVIGLELEIIKCANLDEAVESTSEFTALQEAMSEFSTAEIKIDGHLDNKNNPHEVTVAQIGAAASNHNHSTGDITSGTLPIARGGTGATNIADAQKNLKIYTNITQLGLTYPCTISDIIDAIPEGSSANLGYNLKSDGITDAPISFGEVSIFFPSTGRRVIFCTQCISSGGNFSNFYLGYYNSSDRTVSWYKIPNGSMITSIQNGGTGATTASGALTNLGAVPTTRTINSKSLSADVTLSASDVGAVPTIRTVNSKVLSSDITLTYSDVGAASSSHSHSASAITSGSLPIIRGGTGATNADNALTNLGAVPTTRTINSKALSSDVTLSAADVGAASTSHSHSASAITSGTLPITRGGTGATTASNARTNLGFKTTTFTATTDGSSFSKVPTSILTPSTGVILCATRTDSGGGFIVPYKDPSGFYTIGNFDWNLSQSTHANKTYTYKIIYILTS